jgi:hypothetical protein
MVAIIWVAAPEDLALLMISPSPGITIPSVLAPCQVLL